LDAEVEIEAKYGNSLPFSFLRFLTREIQLAEYFTGFLFSHSPFLPFSLSPIQCNALSKKYKKDKENKNYKL
jgi:hypothetical protein